MNTLLIFAPTKVLLAASIDLSDLGFPEPYESGYYLTATRTPQKLIAMSGYLGCLYVLGTNHEWMIPKHSVEILI